MKTKFRNVDLSLAIPVVQTHASPYTIAESGEHKKR